MRVPVGGGVVEGLGGGVVLIVWPDQLPVAHVLGHKVVAVAGGVLEAAGHGQQGGVS